MNRRVAMPSPNNSNHERLFMPLAHDAVTPTDPRLKTATDRLRRRGVARDDNGLGDALDGLMQHLQDNLPPDALAQSHTLIEQLMQAAQPDDASDDPDDDTGTTALDRRRRLAGDGFPTPVEVAGDIGLGSLSRTKVRPGDDRRARQAEDEFQKMFPGTPVPRLV